MRNLLNKIKRLPLSLQLCCTVGTLGIWAGSAVYFRPLWPLIEMITQHHWHEPSDNNDHLASDSDHHQISVDSSWTTFSELSPHIIHAVLSAEDSRFFEHRGLDYREIWRSMQMNIHRKQFHRGGSTISQQLVKIVTGETQKTLGRKFREAIGAKLLEGSMSKEEILTYYLNLVHFGAYADGVARAAQHYFTTTPEQLTLNESIHLALVLPHPRSRSEGLRHRSLTSMGHRRFLGLLFEMLNRGYITQQQYGAAVQTGDFGRPLRQWRRSLPG